MSKVGPKMSMVVAFVERNPGLAMMHAARFVGPNGSLKYGYESAHRALRAGLVRDVAGPRGATLLFPVDVEVAS